MFEQGKRGKTPGAAIVVLLPAAELTSHFQSSPILGYLLPKS